LSRRLFTFYSRFFGAGMMEFWLRLGQHGEELLRNPAERRIEFRSYQLTEVGSSRDIQASDRLFRAIQQQILGLSNWASASRRRSTMSDLRKGAILPCGGARHQSPRPATACDLSAPNPSDAIASCVSWPGPFNVTVGSSTGFSATSSAIFRGSSGSPSM
jgi:hypothetical protein